MPGDLVTSSCRPASPQYQFRTGFAGETVPTPVKCFRPFTRPVSPRLLRLLHLQTRAIRRRLSTFEASRKTLKQTKKDIHFPKAIYAIKA